MSCSLREIDGSILEGGGQILRIALTLSVIKRIPIRIINIRAGRSKPGLMEQHLKGIELLRDLSNARIKGASLGSTEVEFWPDKVAGGNYEARVKTAGSISLLLQAALPCALFADSRVTLRLFGGTNAEMAPQIDYTTEVFRPILEKFGGSFDFDLIRRGYFPKGGGEVVINIEPIFKLDPVNMTKRGYITSVFGWSFVAGTLPIKLSHLMADSAVHTLKQFHSNIKIERYKEDRNMAPDNCSGVILVAETSTGCILGGSALGKRNESAEETGKRAAQELAKAIEEGACVDGHTQDQLIVFMALAQGRSSVKVGEITMHTKTAIFVAEKMTDVWATFEIVPEGSCNIIHCTAAK
ncbi:RNA 3'-terminal phosphate cyclase [Asbolus verrucosus]|uniref:RNA 3'-terminal phosphate cyclase n=1 Tax=Asbolus verrucosus TaxID=1661398 RepID=A0A482WBM4_ASBVE|nr:RNA 3'-terminal phosphate cyclase [Asbolus verrucosus]